jgi:hypothetical protein
VKDLSLERDYTNRIPAEQVVAELRRVAAELGNRRTPRTQIGDTQLLEELGRVWRLLGHRPSKGEWDSVETTYSYTTYKQRFGGWVNACVAFLEGEAGTDVPAANESAVADEASPKVDSRPAKPTSSNPRYIPLKVRLQVMKRDSFRCVMCGRSPATQAGVQLHIDHVIPFSRGGASNSDNLQTLCQDCNLGKGSDESLARPV